MNQVWRKVDDVHPLLLCPCLRPPLCCPSSFPLFPALKKKRKKCSLPSGQRSSITREWLRVGSSALCSIFCRRTARGAVASAGGYLSTAHYITYHPSRRTACNDLTDSAVACSHSQGSSLCLATLTHSLSFAHTSRRVNKLTLPLGGILPMSWHLMRPCGSCWHIADEAAQRKAESPDSYWLFIKY